jgi:biotin synthase-related radical SAM superfamily protein
MVFSLGTKQKAKLLEIGEIHIPREIDMPCFASRSTAGPDAGSSSHAFQFGNTRVKLGLTKSPDARLRLNHSPEGYAIFLDGKMFVEHVNILPLAAHAPNQAFLNLSGECIMGCAFCAMPMPTARPSESLSPERTLKIIAINSRHPGFEAVAITSGIPDSVIETNLRMLHSVGEIRAQYPAIPIGVEPYIEDLSDLQRFMDAGATEMKINIEAWPAGLFRKVCPNRDRENTLAALEKSVEIFGRGKVTSNIIIGLGEKDDDVIEGLNVLSKMGVIPNIRGIRLGSENQNKLHKALGSVPERVSADRMLGLAAKHRKILETNNLDASNFDTMCFSCRCCDIVPMRDF